MVPRQRYHLFSTEPFANLWARISSVLLNTPRPSAHRGGSTQRHGLRNLLVNTLSCWLGVFWVVAGGVEGELADDLTVAGSDDADVEVGDEHQDRDVCAAVAYVEVVELAAVAQGEFPNGSTVSWRTRKCASGVDGGSYGIGAKPVVPQARTEPGNGVFRGARMEDVVHFRRTGSKSPTARSADGQPRHPQLGQPR